KKLLPFLDDPTFFLFVTSLVSFRIDYCNFLYRGLPDSTLYPISKAFKSAAHLVARATFFSHLSPYLVLLQWLPIKNLE
ncbi:hypothetical protein HELRODRAFT_70803, partial [Helobdella robusta]|uniref:Uncharacterized protein n=1 Tax=Helobdella robusta TaxID=6412 RepID=T1G0C5_HELRO